MATTHASGVQVLTPELIQLGNEVLSLIEIEEAKLLNWGFIRGSLDLRTHLLPMLSRLPAPAQELWQKLQAEGYTDAHLLSSLLKRQLVFRLADDTYRTRFAETVRLLYLLRQRFSHKDWATAPKLVSDLKLELKRRTYPSRSISVAELDQKLREVAPTSRQRDVIHQLLQGPDGTTLQLASFQADAILRQLLNLRHTQNQGLVIGAGTGAGKTKAFYIPAFAHLAETIDPQQPYLQALAIYPRNELLKDQLAEAFAEARKLDWLLIQQGKRPITMGAYFGDTPESADWLVSYKLWPKSRDGNGYVCPYFSCPRDPSHTLIWENADVDAEKAANQKRRFGEHARLRCTSCGYQTQIGQLALTRQQMRAAPPDILFTSTEMLNRRMSSTMDFALFGIGQARPPRLVLLDEIHTYEGITGAQNAYLLRRWCQARGHKPGQNLVITGLSATLTDAAPFFARLTGIPEHHVNYIAPRDEDLIEEGMEYNLVVKGDPVAGTSLLATSIQSAMLLGRTLDPLPQGQSNGAYGQRIFAFSDKLDVINRWYHSMYDAEFNKKLSQYRLPVEENLPPLELRRQQGQVWELSQQIGHDLSKALPISRTTSQDPGVNQKSVLVIATSTLEVGFNDPAVGAVLQHKAPRSMASFLQRKGRAGRVRAMRPWTAVVTSAYGRDRWAFQHAEELFNPLLPPLDLPVENYYVRKIQAAYAIMDWAAQQFAQSRPGGYIWQMLSTGTDRERSDYFQSVRRQLSDLLLDILRGPKRKNFESFLQKALGMEAQDPAFHNLLWGEPRSLYYEVLPTLIRQLETQWRKVEDTRAVPWADATARYPMPDFVPPSLFGDLNLPEVQIGLPANSAQPNDNDMERSMPVTQAMVEFAPGRASKRFVKEYRKDIAHWLALPDEAQLTRNVLNLEFLDITFDEAESEVVHQGVAYKVYRPRVYTLSELPRQFRSTAYAELMWRTQIDIDLQHEAETTPRVVFPGRSPWSRYLLTTRSFTQATGAWVKLTRFAVGVQTDLRTKIGDSLRHHLRFEDSSGNPNTGIGCEVLVDAIQFTLAPLDLAELRAAPAWPELYRHFGPAYFRHLLHTDSRLVAENLNPFVIDWLWQLELSMLTATAIAQGCSLSAAAQEVASRRSAFAERTLRTIFQSQASRAQQPQTNTRAESDAEDTPFEPMQEFDASPELVGRLHLQLLELMNNAVVTSALQDAAQALWTDTLPGLDDWLHASYASSFGAVLLAALTRLVPDIDPDELALDIDGLIVWISEKTAGGVGYISKLTEVITQHPRRFELQLDDVVHYCDRAANAQYMRRVTQLLAAGDPDLSAAFKQIRTTTDLASISRLKESLQHLLQQHGISPSRPVLVGLNTKFLRPNSETDSDQVVVQLVEAWEREETRLGTAIDLRAMAVAARRISTIDTAVMQLMDRISPNQPVDENQIFNLLQSMLWLNCRDSCPECIETWQPYQPLTFPSRALVMALLTPVEVVVDFASPTWLPDARQALISEHQVRIACTSVQCEALKAALAHFLTTPLDIGYQTFYPMVERVSQQGNRWEVHLVIQEMIGA